MQPTMINPPAATGPQSLESRLALLENALKPVNNTITLQVGQSKIVISPNNIEISCPGTITIKALKVDLDCQTDMNMRIQGNLSEKASGSLSVEASGTLTLKGATINQN